MHPYGGRLDASGRKTTYAWDPLGALTRVASLDASGNTVIAYDYTFDEAQRLSRVTDSRAGQWLGYQWSPGGQLNRLTDSDGRATAYQYGPSGRLTSLWAPDGEQLSLAYDAGGRLLERRFGNGAGSRFAWNADGTLAQRQNFANAANTLVSQHDYAYDALGRRTRHLEQIAGTSTDYRYTYDGLGRLSAARNAGGTLLEGYTYDLTGNRLTRTTASGTEAYVYDSAAAAQLLEVRTGSSTGTLTRAFAYDPNGSLTRQCSGSSVTRSTNTCSGSDVASYGYDALERLIQVSLTGSQTLTESYGYDPQGRRILKTTNGAKTQYRYAGDDLYADYGTSLASPRTMYLQGAGTDEPLLAIDPANAANRRYYHADGLGSLVAVTDSTGSVQASRRYDSFGHVLASAGSLPTYGYSGREPDASGLMYYRARYYAPELGRFTQADPIGLAGGINRYAYVGGSPVNFRDPSGWRAINVNPGGQTAYGGNADLLDPLAAMSPQDAGAYEAQGGMLGTRSVMQPIAEVGIVAGVTTLTAGVGGGPVARMLMGRTVREELKSSSDAENIQLFQNLAPKDDILPSVLFPANQIKDVSYNGRLTYVVKESGELVIGRTPHTSLSGGGAVQAAGEVRFVNGEIRSIDNLSGHYRPSGEAAKNAAESAFNRAGFNATGKYAERNF